MRFNPENVTELIKKTRGAIKRNPSIVLTPVIASAALLINAAAPSIANAIIPGRALEEQQKEAQAKATAKAQQEVLKVKQEALRRDYEETAGVNMNRVGDTDTFLFTISRPSAVLARTREEIIGRVIAKVSKETGCPSIITSVVWEDTAPRMPWDAPKPTILSATAVCPR